MAALSAPTARLYLAQVLDVLQALEDVGDDVVEAIGEGPSAELEDLAVRGDRPETLRGQDVGDRLRLDEDGVAADEVSETAGTACRPSGRRTIGPMTPADFVHVRGRRRSTTSESGMTANDLMFSRFPALMTAVIDLTSSTRKAFIQRSSTAAACPGVLRRIADHLVEHADVALDSALLT